MYKKYINFLLLITIVICSASCANTKKSTYFLDARDTTFMTREEDAASPLIQKNDILNITITSLNAEASAIFNLSNNTNSSIVRNRNRVLSLVPPLKEKSMKI